MALSKSKKKEVLEKVAHVAGDAQSVVFVNFHGLTVADATNARRQLRTSNVGYTVAKKTLTEKAFTEAGVKGTMPELLGELAIAYLPKAAGDDVTAPAREVYALEKKLEGKFSILGGVFAGAFMSKEEMTAIATIPSKQTLYGMFVNIINSPIQRFVIAMDQIAKTKTS